MAWCDLFRYPPKQTYFQRQLNTSKEFRKKVFDGERDVLTGVEVSAMSDATLADPRDAWVRTAARSRAASSLSS